MKTIGIVRRIDDLGRIVIPKEIRNTLRIKSGDNLDVMVYDNKIILQKFSNVAKVENLVCDYVSAFSSSLHIDILVSDRDRIVSSSDFLKDKYLNKEISDTLLRLIDCRDKVSSKQKADIEFVNGKLDSCYYSISSIVSNSDAVGSVVVFSSDRPLSVIEDSVSSVLAKLLVKHLEY